ncbi:MAG: lamin tail domain-containing protein [Saprospiraceae bacterium]
MQLVKKFTGLILLLCASLHTSWSQSIVINEFMAENDTITMITDESYQYDDWIELFNLENTPVDLSGFFITDKEGELDKWEFPSGTIIPANGYLVVWADDDENQGSLHTNFKLSKSGEFIALASPDLTILDSITFGEQEKAVALARIPNGTGDFTQRAPTFSTNNEGTTSTNVALSNAAFFQLSPNPTTEQVFLNFFNLTKPTIYQIEIYTLTGQRIYTQSQQFAIDQSSHRIALNDFSPGIYFIQVQSATTRFSQKLIIR